MIAHKYGIVLFHTIWYGRTKLVASCHEVVEEDTRYFQTTRENHRCFPYLSTSIYNVWSRARAPYVLELTKYMCVPTRAAQLPPRLCPSSVFVYVWGSRCVAFFITWERFNMRFSLKSLNNIIRDAMFHLCCDFVRGYIKVNARALQPWLCQASTRQLRLG